MNRDFLVTAIAIELMSRLPEWKREERRDFANEILQCIDIELDSYEEGIEYD